MGAIWKRAITGVLTAVLCLSPGISAAGEAAVSGAASQEAPSPVASEGAAGSSQADGTGSAASPDGAGSGAVSDGASGEAEDTEVDGATPAGEGSEDAVDLSGRPASQPESDAVASDEGDAETLEPAAPGGATIAEASSFGAGSYQIASSAARSQRIEVRGGSTSDGAVIQLYRYNKTPAQSWRLEASGDGSYVIRNVKSGKVLDVRDGRAYAGAEVRIWSANGSAAQRWVVEASGDGFIFRSALDRNLVLDVANGSTANGTQVRLWTANGSAAQRFLVAAEDVKVAKTDRTLADGTYVLRDPSGLALDVRNGSRASGTAAQSYAANGTVAQSFYVSYDARAGFYTVRSALSGLVLDADMGDVVPGAPVSLWGGPSYASRTQFWRIEQGEDGRLAFINAANGQMLGLAAAGAGAQAATFPASDSRARTWSAEASSFKYSRAEIDQLARDHVSDLPDGSYLIGSAVDRSRVLDVENGSRAENANVRLYASNMTAAQRWTVTHDAQGYVSFRNAGSGKMLDVRDGSAADGTNVWQHTANGAYAQKWVALKNGDGTYRLIPAVGGAYALESAGTGASNGANIQIGTARATASQSFYLIGKAVEPAPGADILPKGYFSLAPASSGSGRVLDAANGGTANGTNVQLYQANDTLAQLFSFEYVDGYYRIVNLKSGAALDVADGNLAPGGNVQLYAGARDNQYELFAARDNGDGTYTFINKACGYALDISAGADRNGANVQVWPSNGLSPQRFRLVPARGLVSEGAYEIVAPSAGSRVLDVKDGSLAEGARVQLWAANGTFAQKWYVRRVGDNVYEIESLLSGKLLTASGAAVTQAVRPQGGSTAAQRWVPDYVRGSFAFVNAQTGQALTASSDGSLGLRDRTDAGAQRFDLRGTAVIAAGTYTLTPTSDTSLRLDVAASSTATGATVQAWAANGAAAQKWDVRPNGDGTYEIASVLSNKVLDVKDGNAYSGASVRLWERNGAPAQRWRITYDGRGGLRISSVLNDSLVLGTLGGGRPTTLVADGAAGAQRFEPVATEYVPPILGGVAWKGNGVQHYSSGRGGNDWSVVVIHISECQTLEQIDWTFWGTREASAHYGVGDTRIHQYVNLNDTAWAVGNWFWNQRSISIEHVGTTANPPSYQTLDTSARLMAALARSKGWRSYQMGKNLNIHKNYTDTACPATLDVNWLYAKANEYLGNGFTTNPAVQPW